MATHGNVKLLVLLSGPPNREGATRHSAGGTVRLHPHTPMRLIKRPIKGTQSDKARPKSQPCRVSKSTLDRGQSVNLSLYPDQVSSSTSTADPAWGTFLWRAYSILHLRADQDCEISGCELARWGDGLVAQLLGRHRQRWVCTFLSWPFLHLFFPTWSERKQHHPQPHTALSLCKGSALIARITLALCSVCSVRLFSSFLSLFDACRPLLPFPFPSPRWPLISCP